VSSSAAGSSSGNCLVVNAAENGTPGTLDLRDERGGRKPHYDFDEA